MAGLSWTDIGGTGTPFVLVHGYTGSSDDFRSVVEPLTDIRRVVLVDQLGHGGSPRSADYTFAGLTRALLEFLLTDIGEPVDLLGHSMGGRTVLPIASHHPQLVRSLIMMDTWADFPDQAERSDALRELFSQPDDAVLTAIEDGGLDVGKDHERRLHIVQWGEPWVTARELCNAERLDPNARVQLGRQVFVESPSVLADAADIQCPTTVLVGELDAAFRGASQRLVDQIPGAKQVIIDGAYHSPQLSHPPEWVDALRSHLADAN